MMKSVVRVATVSLSLMPLLGLTAASAKTHGWIMEDEKSPKHASLDAMAAATDTVKEVRAVNVLIGATGVDTEIEQRVLDTALAVMRQTRPDLKFKLKLHNRFESQVIQSQEYFQFEQVIDGYPVDGMGISVMAKPTSKGLSIRLVDFRYVTPEQPDEGGKHAQLMDSQVFARAESALGGFNAPLHLNKVMWKFIAGKRRLVREMQKVGQEKQVQVDIRTGEVFTASGIYHLEEPLMEAAVVAKGVFSGPVRETALAVDLPMGFMKLKMGSKQSFSDATGKFQYDSSAKNLAAGFIGQWASVDTESGKNLKLSASLDPKQAQYGFPVEMTDELAVAQSNAYFHVTRIHQWLNAHGLKDSSFDRAVSTSVNIDDNCNAYYTGGVIHFFKSGGDENIACVNTAYDSVVYHEYGHLVDEGYGGITEGGLSEGWGDVLSTFITNVPEVGKDFFTKGRQDQNYIRTGENSYQMPADGDDEVHRIGQAWMGFAWKLRKNLIDKLGSEAGTKLAEELILPSLSSNAVDTAAAVRETLVRDDDDGDLKNGTPHFAEIQAAAKAHAMESYLEIK